MPPDPDTLENCCKRLRDSDRDALGDLFDVLYEPLYRYVRSITHDAPTARDICQDTFVYLWDHRESLDPSKSLRAYIYRMARNRAYNQQRNRNTRTEKEDEVRGKSDAQPARPDSPAEIAQGQEFERRLREWIASLPSRQREAIVLSRFEGLTHEQIARIMDISPRTVNNHIVRALKRIRERVENYDSDLFDNDG